MNLSIYSGSWVYIKAFETTAFLSVSIMNLRHTYTSRLLYTILPSENYAPNNATLHCLVSALVKDCNHLLTNGFKAPQLHCMALVGNKRSCFKLNISTTTLTAIACYLPRWSVEINNFSSMQRSAESRVIGPFLGPVFHWNRATMRPENAIFAHQLKLRHPILAHSFWMLLGHWELFKKIWLLKWMVPIASPLHNITAH